MWLRDLVESRGPDYHRFLEVQRIFNENPYRYGSIRPILQDGRTELLITDRTNRELILERLGTGVQQLLVLLSQIAGKNDDSFKVFGIEELELNLSPGLQANALKMLIQMTENENSAGFSQVFLTSHSPYICLVPKVNVYGVSIDDAAGTSVKHGERAVEKIAREHFKLDDFIIPRKSEREPKVP
jgi:hypothetical protein